LSGIVARRNLAFSDTDRRIVTVLARYGVPISGLALELGVDDKTVRRHFAAELKIAAASQVTDVTIALYRKAAKGSVTAARLWFNLFVRRT
jgi:hypothetical protein